jgi:hypothetical protein
MDLFKLYRNWKRKSRIAKVQKARRAALFEAYSAEARGDDRRLGAARMVLAQLTLDELTAARG